MDSQRAKDIFEKYKSAIAYVDVELPDGDRSIGSAFHVGGGIYVTARHVLENNQVIEVRSTESLSLCARDYLRESLTREPSDEEVEKQEGMYSRPGYRPMFRHQHEPLRICAGPFFHSDPNLDVAVFRVENSHHATPWIKLSLLWDSWIPRANWQLYSLVIMGYPPVPMVNEPILIAARAEVHAHIVPRHANGVHFLVSATPRGGFSGGVALDESGRALGVITSSLGKQNEPEQIGFFSVLAIQSVLKCLIQNELLVDPQYEHLKAQAGYDFRPILTANEKLASVHQAVRLKF